MTEIPPRGAGAPSGRFLGHTLPSGARIGNFEITGLIGEGGFARPIRSSLAGEGIGEHSGRLVHVERNEAEIGQLQRRRGAANLQAS